MEQLACALHARAALALAIIVDDQHLIALRRQRLCLGEVPFLRPHEIREKQNARLGAGIRIAHEHGFERAAGAFVNVNIAGDGHGSCSLAAA